MQPLALYPSTTNLKRGLGIGLAAAVLGAYLWTLDGAPEFTFLALLGVGFGGYMALVCGRRLHDPSAVFEADATGFSVKGKGRRPWEEFRGVQIHRTHSGPFIVSRHVRIKVGKSMLGGFYDLKWYELSGSAADVVMAIQRYADAAMVTRHHATMDAVVKAQPLNLDARLDKPKEAPQQAPALMPTPIVEQAALAGRPIHRPAADSGPIQSVPSLGQRIFGRKT